ncbi:MAG TPA: HisA/HisF-related TIM barrel protein, partial [Methanocorpusculum sp.]|nr:HisA/HisF-related TIM barrel protein [Methanocorpusculum sp.]
DKVSLNTSAVKTPELITEGSRLFGNQCIVLAEDVRRNYEMKEGVTPMSDETGEFWYEVVIYGGSHRTGLDAVKWAEDAVSKGAGEILLTSMETDGVKTGFDLMITSAVSDAVDVPVIASGGVGELSHFYGGFVLGKADACLAASVFHYGEMTISQVKEYLHGRGVPVRL